jgi:hypothetical protein
VDVAAHPVDPKIIERVGKLLRLAAPSAGGTVAEQVNAMTEAAKLIDEHGLVVAQAPPKERKRKRPSQAATSNTPVDPNIWIRHVRWVPPTTQDWTASVAHATHECCACHQPLVVGEAIWVSTYYGYRHYNITCTDGEP